MKYNLNYFIDKFSALNNWCIGRTRDGHGNYCALGHCGCNNSWSSPITEEANALESILASYYINHSCGAVMPMINDGIGEFETFADNPKDRILAALYRIQLHQAVEQAKEIINNTKILSANIH
jgi:hypothetical protein